MTAFNEQVALREFRYRQAKYAKTKRIHNEDLPAGSDMFYYCRGCGQPFPPMPETHGGSAPRWCGPCELLHEHGLL